MTYHIYFPIEKLSSQRGISERKLSDLTQVSRACLRDIKRGDSNLTLGPVCAVAEYFDKHIEVLATSAHCDSEYSTVATAMKVARDGFESWKIHFFDFVDELRRTSDPRLVILPPPSGVDKELKALLASLARFLCEEIGMSPPSWTLARYYLEQPWFPAGIESLKASAILESPTAFRNNNIFVLSNFAERA